MLPHAIFQCLSNVPDFHAKSRGKNSWPRVDTVESAVAAENESWIVTGMLALRRDASMAPGNFDG